MPEDLFAFDQDHYGGLAVAYRVLKHGGRLAFTDWAEHRRLDETDSESMWRGIAAQSVQSFVGYPQMLREIGFRHVAADSRPRNESVTPVPRMKNSSRPATYNSTQ